MKRRRFPLLGTFLATMSATALTLIVAVPADAVADTTPPSLKLPHYATFVVGSQLSDTALGPDRFDAYFPGSLMEQKLGWRATDDGSGICDLEVYDVLAGSEPELILSDPLATGFTRWTTDYDDQEGGGSFKTEGFDVVATDCAGNTTTKFAGARPVVTQEDGWTYGYSGVSLTYSSGWKTSKCGCWSADRTRKTTRAGAAVNITRTWQEGQSVALVMETAPNRGAFKVKVDGKRVAIVDTYAATKTHRVIVWAARMREGVHKIRVVNLATPGRERIDLDAVINGG